MQSIRTQKGFSLIEVLITMGLMGVVSLFVATVARIGFDSQKSITAIDDGRILTSQIAALLGDEDACLNTLGGYNPTTTGTGTGVGAPAPTAGKAFTAVRNASNAVVYQTNTKYGSNRLSSMVIGGSGTDPKVGALRFEPNGSSDGGMALVVVRWAKLGDAIGAPTTERFFFVNVNFNPITHAITACSASGGLTGEELWQRGTPSSSIFYNEGNVGIGTTSPNGRLTISNNVATGFLDTYAEYQAIFFDTGTAATNYGIGIKGNTLVFNSGGGAYSFDGLGNSSRMVIASNGQVGIGVATPTTGLDVMSGENGFPLTSGTNTRAVARFSPVGTNVTLDLGVSSVGAGWLQVTNAGNLAATGSLVLNPNGGRVGIGTTAPIYAVDINPGASGAGLRVQSGQLMIDDEQNSGNTRLVIKNQGTGSSDRSIIILASSRGNGYPDSGYDIGTLSFRCAYGAANTLCNNGSKILVTATQNHNASSQGSQMKFFTVQNGQNTPSLAMMLDHNGNVGINNGTPSQALDVTGNIRSSNLGGCDLRANASGVILCVASDARLKHDIRPLENSLEKIRRLTGVSYEWNRESGFSGEKEVGFTAQDVEKEYPWLVRTGKDGFKQLRIGGLIAPLVEAVKELYAMILGTDKKVELQAREIAELKKRNEDLQKQNAEILRRLEALERRPAF